MVRGSVFLTFLLISVGTKAQQSIRDSTGSIKTKINTSSFQSKTPNSLDTISPNAAHYKHHLDSAKRSLTHKIDSLNKLKLPTAQYTRKLDSLNRIDPLKVVKQDEAKVRAEEQKVTGTVTGLEKKVNQELNSLTKDAEGGAGLPSTNSIPGANLPGTNLPGVNLPGVNPNLNNSLSLPNTSLPNVNDPLNANTGLGDVQKDMNSVSGLPQKELSELKNIPDVNDAEKDMGAAGKMTQKANGYGKEISGVANGDSASTAQLEKTAESDAKNLEGMKDLQKETGVMNNYQNMASQVGNPQALEKDVLTQAPQPAINHFAGKEQVLTGAMSQISKIKQKYSKVTSLKDLPKHPPNPMKGKPLIERLVPGVSFQVLKVNKLTEIDLNPQVGYKFNGHLTAGAGWNERIGIEHFRFSTQSRIYGPRVYGEYKMIKGFALRAEVETMNTYIPPDPILNSDPSGRRWVWNSFAGLKRDYKIFKHLKGNIQMLYQINSLFTQHRYAIYGDPLTVRMGFEFPMKKRAKTK